MSTSNSTDELNQDLICQIDSFTGIGHRQAMWIDAVVAFDSYHQERRLRNQEIR